MVADALRYNRTDTALVRVVVPVVDGDMENSQKAAIDFVQSFYFPLRQHFPPNLSRLFTLIDTALCAIWYLEVCQHNYRYGAVHIDST